VLTDIARVSLRWTDVSDVFTASIVITATMMMEAISTSETSVNFYETTWHIPEVSHPCHRKSLKSLNFSLVHCRSEKCDLPPHSHTPSLISAWVMATRTVTLGHFTRPVLTPIQPLFNGYGASFPGVKTAGAWKTIKPMYCRYV
jgi:hypothetical protein